MTGAQENKWERLGDFCCIFIICAAIAVRFYAYISGRGMWMDEGLLYCAIRDYSLGDLLTKPLPHVQLAPAAFMLATKIITMIFGINEFSLRFIPFVAGCAVPVALFILLRKRFDNLVVLPTIFLAAFFPPFIFYSNEFKPYSLDAALAVLLLAGSCPVWRDTSSGGRSQGVIWRQDRAVFVAGLICMLFSSTIVFILAGIGTTIFASEWLRAPLTNLKRALRRAMPLALGWLAFFAIYYMLYLKPNSHPQFYVYWHDWFFKPSPSWALDRMIDIGVYLRLGKLTLPAFAVGGMLFCAGSYALYKKDRFLAIALGSSLLALLAASSLKLYPLHLRLILFMLPLVFFIIILGLAFFIEKLPSLKLWGTRHSVILCAATALITLIVSAAAVRFMVETPSTPIAGQKGFKSIIPKIIQEHQQYDAVIFVDTLWPVFQFYTELNSQPLPYEKLPVNSADETFMAEKIVQMRKSGQHMAVLVFYKDDRSGLTALRLLEQVGTARRQYHTSDTNVYFIEIL